jgi:hypothetical protein
MGRPVVFICSTVHDLRDMRSALRWWFEEMGYEVRASEFSDFPGTFGRNSYDACLHAVEGSDIVVVLIGNRAGGVFDSSQGVTIARREYQTAYQQYVCGRTKVIVFVRDEVWTLYQDRKRLEKQHDSKVLGAHDASLIFPFIDEVRRLDEMRLAAGAGEDRPIGNWVHVFRGFGDVVTALRAQLELWTDYRAETLLANLQWELVDNLCRLGSRWSQVTAPHFHYHCAEWLGTFQAEPGDWAAAAALPKDQRTDVEWYLLDTMPKLALSTHALTSAIDSGRFLEYDPVAGAPTVGVLQSRMVELRNAIGGLRDSAEVGDIDQIRRQVFVRHESLTNGEVLLVRAVWAWMRLVTILSVRIAAYIGSRDVRWAEPVQPAGRPPSRAEGTETRTEALTREHVVTWLGGLDPGWRGG